MGVRQKAEVQMEDSGKESQSQASAVSLKAIRAAGACRHHRRQGSPVMIYTQKGVCLGVQGYTLLD